MTGRKSGKALVAIAVVLTLLAAFVIAGFTGLLFRVWPASFPDTDLVVTPQVIEELKQLRAEPKFKPDPKNFYPGATNERIRLVAEEGVNLVVDQLLAGLRKAPRKSFVLAIIKDSLYGFERFDSEEQERALRYFDRILRILGAQGSNQLFNVWRYGLPYGWALKGA